VEPIDSASLGTYFSPDRAKDAKRLFRPVRANQIQLTFLRMGFTHPFAIPPFQGLNQEKQIYFYLSDLCAICEDCLNSNLPFAKPLHPLLKKFTRRPQEKEKK
jgi:hypothetical protein